MDLLQIETLAAMPAWLLYGMTAFLGAVMASFAGVVAERLPHQIGWRDDAEDGLTIARPPSRCDGCRRRLGIVELIPVIGWLAAGGACRRCRTSVPVVYPIVEAATAAASAATVWWFGLSIEAACILVLLWSFIALTWMDITDHLLPGVITIPLFWMGLVLSPWEPDPNLRILGALAASSAMWISFALTGAVKRVEAMSGGDVALAAAGGAWLGLNGIQSFLLATCAVYVLYAFPLRLRGIVWVPMGPALCVSFLACLLLTA